MLSILQPNRVPQPRFSVANQESCYVLALTVQWEAWIFGRCGRCRHVWVPRSPWEVFSPSTLLTVFSLREDTWVHRKQKMVVCPGLLESFVAGLWHCGGFGVLWRCRPDVPLALCCWVWRVCHRSCLTTCSWIVSREGNRESGALSCRREAVLL